jgi:hypothetical protein
MKMLIRYIRRPVTTLERVLLDKFVGLENVAEEQDLIRNVEKALGKIYAKKTTYHPCGVLICISRDDKLYFGWSYISTMDREGEPVFDRSGRPIVDRATGEQKYTMPPFVKANAVKIALDKINGREKIWETSDMPYAVRAEFDSFLERAKKYFKTNEVANVMTPAETAIAFAVTE